MATQKNYIRRQDCRTPQSKRLVTVRTGKKIGVSYKQMSRYEIKGVQPPANVIDKLANVLGTTIDFLLFGDKDEKVKVALRNAEPLQQIKAVEQYCDDDKTAVKKLIDAFFVKKQLQLMAS